MLFSKADEFLQLRDILTVDLLTNHTKLVEDVVSVGAKSRRMIENKMRAKALPFLLDANGQPVKVKGQQWKGWILPLLGAFRSNVDWDSEAETIEWYVPNKTLIKAAMPEMIKALIKRHDDKMSLEPFRCGGIYIA